MTTGEAQTLSLKRQQIDLDEDHRLHLSDIHCQLGGFSMSEDGVLSVSIPALSAHSLFENLEINEELQTGFNVSDISLTFDPPLSGMLQSLLTMDYPLSSSDLADVYQRFQALKAESVVRDDSDRELSTSSKLSRCVHMKLGGIELEKDGHKTTVPHEAGRDNPALAQAYARLTDTPVDEHTLAQRVHKNTRLNGEGVHHVMNALSLLLLGADSLTEEESQAGDEIQSINEAEASLASVEDELPAEQESDPVSLQQPQPEERTLSAGDNAAEKPLKTFFLLDLWHRFQRRFQAR